VIASKQNPIRGAAPRVNWLLGGAVMGALVSVPASAQSINEMLQHGSNERTVEINTGFPRLQGCGRQFSIVDTVDVGVSGWIDASPALRDAPAGFAGRVVGAVRSRLHLPAVMSVGVFGPDSLAVAAISGAVGFTLDAGGRVHDVHLMNKSTSGTLDGVLQDAVKDASSDNRFPPFPPAYRDKTLAFVMTLSSVLWGSGDAADLEAATPPQDMFGVTLERYRGIQLASNLQLPAGLSLYTAPASPAGTAADSTAAPVWVQFVAGSDGHVVPGTVRVIGSPPQAKAAQVQTLFMHATITPAMVLSCPVPQLMRVPLVIDPSAK
jgi:hypothetical protein